MNPKSPKKFALVCCFAMLLAATASMAGQAGHLDPAFGNGGVVRQQETILQLTNTYSIGGVALQSDGKIVVAGGLPGGNDFTVPAVFRFLSNGGLDTSFGKNGIAVLPNSFGSYGAVAIQSDGKIVAGTSAGGPDAEVDRFTTTGHLDSSFGTNGRVTFRFSSFLGLALQSDGRILAATNKFAGVGPADQVTRLLANGSTDTSFGKNGVAAPPGGAGPLAVLGNGDILVFGGLISRLTSSGVADTEFGVNGQLQAQTGGHVVAADGDIIVTGTLVQDPTVPSAAFATFSYQSVGIGDPAFGKNGGVSTPFAGFPTVTAAGIGLESNGDLVGLGTASTRTSGAFGLVRYTPQGQLDTTFGSGGTVTTSFGNNATVTASAIAIQSDDKIVVAGTVTTVELHGEFNTTLAVARYLAK